MLFLLLLLSTYSYTHTFDPAAETGTGQVSGASRRSTVLRLHELNLNPSGGERLVSSLILPFTPIDPTSTVPVQIKVQQHS